MFLQDLYHRALPLSVQRRLRPLLHPRVLAVQSESYGQARGAVLSGPFQGMRFNREHLSWPLPLGTYEMELHPIFQRLRRRSFSTIIDIGAAEGYYAVGTLLWQPEARVVAYEAQERYHEAIRDLAARNGVLGRIEIRSECAQADLQADLERAAGELPNVFLIVDVEGFEKELLDPETVPLLRRATMLVEVHDNFVPGCAQAMLDRFSVSHRVTRYASRPRRASDYPIRSRLGRSALTRPALRHAISDGRTAFNAWMLLEPRELRTDSEGAVP